MIRHRIVSSAAALAMAVMAAGATGCATKGFVQSEVAQSKAYTDSRFGEAKAGADRAQARADEAFDKATLAERLANGHIEYEEVSAHRVQFAFDDYTLSTEAQQVLDDLGARLASYPRYVLEIRGFADATGPDRYNYRLGRERAESVQRYLMTRHAVPAGRVAIVSFGEEEPLAANDHSAGREQNRRVQVRLLDVQREQGEPVAQSDL